MLHYILAEGLVNNLVKGLVNTFCSFVSFGFPNLARGATPPGPICS